MKISIKSTSKVFVTSILFVLSTQIYASSVARVTSLKGSAFMIWGDKTKSLNVGDEISANAEIITEEGGQISFNDYYDHLYHLSNSGQILLKEKEIELRRGYLWGQGFSDKNIGIVKTANAVTEFSKSEAIISFDNSVGRTQIMAVTGKVKFYNLLETHLERTLDAGNFSFIDQDYEQGIPRTPTMIGFQSYKKLTSLFDGIKSLDPKALPMFTKPQDANKVEMVVAQTAVSVKKDEKREIASASGYFDQLKKSKKIARKDLPKKSAIEMKMHGIEGELLDSLEIAPVRAPANVSDKQEMKEFEQSVKQEESKQSRHTPEVNKLIDELNSYQGDYKKDY